MLRYPDRDEIRLTDYDPRVEGHVGINGAEFEVIDETESSTPGVAWRCVVQIEGSDAP